MSVVLPRLVRDEFLSALLLLPYKVPRVLYEALWIRAPYTALSSLAAIRVDLTAVPHVCFVIFEDCFLGDEIILKTMRYK